MAVDEFWVRQLISHHAPALGAKVGAKAAEVFVERVREVFGAEARKLYSHLYRPAIEDHFQNHAWNEAENLSVVLDRALESELKGREGRGKLLERVAAAYLWGEEALESPRFSYIFESGSAEDLETIIRVFWMVRGQTLSAEQRRRVIEYWERCMVWSQKFSEPPIKLLSSLSLLSCYLTAADGRERELLEAVAPFVYVGHNVYEFISELVRLATVSPDGASSALGRMLKTRIPDFDYKDQLKKLLGTLLEKGKRQDVISHAERLRTLPGIQELFNGLAPN
jgi:hypothetical protein